MLQDIRSKVQGPVVKVIVWLIVISFSIFGIESILVGGGGGGVAEVNGEEITPQELEQALNTQQRRLIAAMGDNFDPAMLEDDALKSQVLTHLHENDDHAAVLAERQAFGSGDGGVFAQDVKGLTREGRAFPVAHVLVHLNDARGHGKAGLSDEVDDRSPDVVRV